MTRLLRTRRREFTRSLRGLLVNRFRVNASGPRILANSIPKAGTHLLTRCLALLPGIMDSGLRMRGRFSDDGLESRLMRVGGGCFIPVHLTYSEARGLLLSELGFQVPLIIRDPRDIAVSHFHYVTHGSRRHRLRAYYASLPDDQARLMTSITGIVKTQTDPALGLPDVGARFRAYLAWAQHGACVVRFENLVGPHGGGTREAQHEAIRRLAEYLGVMHDEETIERIALKVYDPRSSTFRKGSTGDWKHHLSPEHKEAFKRVAGQLLVELGYEQDQNW